MEKWVNMAAEVEMSQKQLWWQRQRNYVCPPGDMPNQDTGEFKKTAKDRHLKRNTEKTKQNRRMSQNRRLKS